MTWMLCYQTPYDNVYYIMSNSDKAILLPFKKFIEFANTLKIKNYKEFKETLDKFQNIIVDLDKLTWKIYVHEQRKDVTFQELLELNKDKAVIKDLRLDKKESKSYIEKMKDTIETISHGRDKSLDRFDRKEDKITTPKTLLDKIWGQ